MLTPVQELDFDHTLVHPVTPWRHELVIGQVVHGGHWNGPVTFIGDEDAICRVAVVKPNSLFKVGQNVRLIFPRP